MCYLCGTIIYIKKMHHPLELFKYCPECGSADFHVKDEKSKRCSACGFVYYFNSSAATVAFILNAKGELLVCRRAKEQAAIGRPVRSPVSARGRGSRLRGETVSSILALGLCCDCGFTACNVANGTLDRVAGVSPVAAGVTVVKHTAEMSSVALDCVEVILRKAACLRGKRNIVLLRHLLCGAKNKGIVLKTDVCLCGVQIAEFRLGLPQLDNSGAQMLHILIYLLRSQ